MAKLRTISIKGKEYVTVNERLKYFREKYPNYGLLSEIIHMDAYTVMVKATIYDDNGRPLASGLASEDKMSSIINETSYVENCDTSAWGRALANFGIGIDVNVASADELNNALERQEALKTKIDKTKISSLKIAAESKGLSVDMVLSRYDLKVVEDMTMEQWASAMRSLEKTEVKK